jgi:hypothetical protein
VKRERILAIAATAGLSVLCWVAGAVEGATAAQAMPNSSGRDFIYPKAVCTNEACSNQWCPGMPLPCGTNCGAGAVYPGTVYPKWDMSVCHDFMIGNKGPGTPPWFDQDVQVAPMILEGDPGWGPGPCLGQPICLPGL